MAVYALKRDRNVTVNNKKRKWIKNVTHLSFENIRPVDGSFGGAGEKGVDPVGVGLHHPDGAVVGREGGLGKGFVPSKGADVQHAWNQQNIFLN